MSNRSNTAAMAGLYFNTVVKSRRSIIAAVLALLILAFFGYAALTIEGGPQERLDLFRTFIFIGPLGFLVQFGGLFYGLAVVSEEVENGTAIYLLVRPLSRAAVLLGRGFAAFASIAGGLVAMTLLVLAMTRPEGAGAALGAALVAIVAGSLAYAAIFSYFGALFKNAVAPSLLYVLLWEMGVSLIPFPVRNFTVKYHLLCIFNGISPGSGGGGAMDELLVRYDVSAGAALAAVLACAVGTALLAHRRFLKLQV